MRMCVLGGGTQELLGDEEVKDRDVSQAGLFIKNVLMIIFVNCIKLFEQLSHSISSLQETCSNVQWPSYLPRGW